MCNIYFKILELEDVLEMKKWGKHDDPLLFDYNIEINNRRDGEKLLFYKTLSPFNKYFAIYFEYKMEGFLGLKNINPLTKNSRLGLVLNPDIVGQGIGTMVSREFLYYYFTDLGFKKMVLDVAGYNTRAYKLYKKVGFKKIKTYNARYPLEHLDITDVKDRNMEDLFFKRLGRWYYKAYEMELKQEVFYEFYYRTK